MSDLIRSRLQWAAIQVPMVVLSLSTLVCVRYSGEPWRVAAASAAALVFLSLLAAVLLFRQPPGGPDAAGRIVLATSLASAMDRTLAARLALFVTGAAVATLAFIVGGMAGLVVPIVLAVAAGLVEARAVHRTRRRHWVIAWLPAALGILFPVGVLMITERPSPADAGLALSILIAGLAASVPVFAAAVLGVAYLAGRAGPTDGGTTR